MSDKKLTDNEIVKALECCSVQGHFVCDECPAWVDSHCIGTHKQTLDLINRLQRENKNYSQNNQTMTKDVLELQKEIARLKMTNEILSINADTAFQDGLNEAQEVYAEQIKVEIKAEAYNELAEWLYSLFPTPNSEIVVISRTGIAKKVNELISEGSNIE